MSVELREVADWGGMTVPDVYFSHKYHLASSMIEVEGTTPLLVEVRKAGGVFRLPLLIRPISGDLWDATSCYGYGGPWWEGEEVVAGIREALDEWARDRGIVSTFLRFHPVLGNSAGAAGIFDALHLNETVQWPLAPALDLLAGMKKKHRQYARKSAREGLTSTVVVNPTNLEDFVRLYHDSMDRLDAGKFYRFSDDYWEAMAEPGGCETIVSDVQFDGQTVASLLCLSGQQFLHAHLLGTNETGRERKANYLAYIAAARWAQENGKSGFHLGGGYGSDGGDLLAWKRGFCPMAEPRQFSVAKVVHDPETYRQLAGSDSTDGFFPPWRQL